MDYTNAHNTNTSSKLQVITTLERQEELLKHFTPEFVEKHKQCYLFKGVMAELTKGANPYLIIKQLIEHLASASR